MQRYAPRGKANPNAVAWNARWDKTWFTGKAVSPALTVYDVRDAALNPGAVTPMFREILRRAFNAGAFCDLGAKVFEEQLMQISAHSTRVEINQHLSCIFSSLLNATFCEYVTRTPSLNSWLGRSSAAPRMTRRQRACASPPSILSWEGRSDPPQRVPW